MKSTASGGAEGGATVYWVGGAILWLPLFWLIGALLPRTADARADHEG